MGIMAIARDTSHYCISKFFEALILNPMLVLRPFICLHWKAAVKTALDTPAQRTGRVLRKEQCAVLVRDVPMTPRLGYQAIFPFELEKGLPSRHVFGGVQVPHQAWNFNVIPLDLGYHIISELFAPSHCSTRK